MAWLVVVKTDGFTLGETVEPDAATVRGQPRALAWESIVPRLVDPAPGQDGRSPGTGP